MNKEEPKTLNYNNLNDDEITQELLEQLINLRLTSLRIAKKLNRSPIFIYRLMRKFGLKILNLREKRERVKIKCNQCSKEVLKIKDPLGKHLISYCSHSCAATYVCNNKTHGTRRSKLEIYLEDKLKSLYPNLEIHCNRKDTINSELDFYFPSLNLAFELNGIFHYEPIYGEIKLKQIQNNDERKFQACLEKGIELCIVDSSKMNNFKDTKAKPYLAIFKKIINKKLSCVQVTIL
jgi:hypothetical protein